MSARKRGKQRYNKSKVTKGDVPRTVPRAPFNDSSFLMRVRKAGGLESQIVPLTPFSFMSTPKDSSYKLDTYEEDYGYGSMTGLIRLRSYEDDDNRSCCSNNSDAEERELSLEQRLDRFEMTHPVLRELQTARQDCYLKCLEDENVVLKDRIFQMQQEISELRRRLQ
jgi:hypothetical protein